MYKTPRSGLRRKRRSPGSLAIRFESARRWFFPPPLAIPQTPRRSPAPTSRGGRAFSERAQRRDFALNSATKFAEQDIKLESGRMIFSLLRHVGMFGHFAARGKELPLAIAPLPVSRSHRSPSHKWVRGTVIP